MARCPHLTFRRCTHPKQRQLISRDFGPLLWYCWDFICWVVRLLESSFFSISSHLFSISLHLLWLWRVGHTPRGVVQAIILVVKRWRRQSVLIVFYGIEGHFSTLISRILFLLTSCFVARNRVYDAARIPEVEVTRELYYYPWTLIFEAAKH